MELKKKIIRGLKWSGISQVGKQVSQFIVTVVLARLLSPGDFGLVAVAMVFINFALIFGELGLSSALVQKQNTFDTHFSSAFWLNIICSIVLTLVFIGLAPLIAAFYHNSALKPVLMVMSLNFVLVSFTAIQQTILQKEMDFKALAIRDIVAVIVSGVVGIVLAYRGYGVWSLVYQLLMFTFVDGILLWFFSKWRPKFIFSIEAIKDIFHFSANVTGFNIINYFARNVAQLLIGKFLGFNALGYYALAYKIVLYPLQNISGVINKVMFPVFSRIQNDLKEVRNAYLKMVKAISLVAFPLMVSLFVFAPEFVHVFIGKKWEMIVFLIRIFCVCGIVQAVSITVGNIRLSQGQSRMQFKIGSIHFICMIIAIWIGLFWGIYGVAFSYTIFYLFWFFYTIGNILFLIKLKASIFYGNLTVPAILNSIFLMVLTILKYLLIDMADISRLCLLCGLGMLCYFIFLWGARIISVKDRKIIFSL
ncbi:MAG: MOP flippase family protein [Candidatus Omnitrophica bacterium]|nr:MOP flippase family protein [Candidatus Omnitrophota bacterium]